MPFTPASLLLPPPATMSSLASKLHNELFNPDSFLRRPGGIAVKNTTPFPLLVSFSVGTPLHWSERMVAPGETFNEHNKLGLGKFWFTVTVAPWDPHEVPSVAGTALAIGRVVLGVVLVVATVAVVVASVAAAASKNSEGEASVKRSDEARRSHHSHHHHHHHHHHSHSSSSDAAFDVARAFSAGPALAEPSPPPPTIPLPQGWPQGAPLPTGVSGCYRRGVYSNGQTLTVGGELDGAGVFRMRFVEAQADPPAPPHEGAEGGGAAAAAGGASWFPPPPEAGVAGYFAQEQGAASCAEGSDCCHPTKAAAAAGGEGGGEEALVKGPRVGTDV